MKSVSDVLPRVFDITAALVSGAERGYRKNCDCDSDSVRRIRCERDVVSWQQTVRSCNVSPTWTKSDEAGVVPGRTMWMVVWWFKLYWEGNGLL